MLRVRIFFFFFGVLNTKTEIQMDFQNTHWFCVLFYSAVKMLHILSRAVSKGNCLNFHMKYSSRSVSTKSFICVSQILRAVWNWMEESGSAISYKKNYYRLLCNLWTFWLFFTQIHCSDQSSYRKEQEKNCFVTLSYNAALHHFHGEEMMSKVLLKRRKEAPRTGGFNFPFIFLIFW